MIPGRIPDHTRVLGAPVEWDDGRPPCVTLAIRDEMRGPGVPVMVSAWLPSAEELAALNAGASLILSVVGRSHPPVTLAVGAPPP